MSIIEDRNLILNNTLPNVSGILDKDTGMKYSKGENPYYDMQIINFILCPAGVQNWFGFIKSKYELF